MTTDIIESLTDRAAYVALGASNTTPGATDDETMTWALDATRARVADTATDEDRARILGWVRVRDACDEYDVRATLRDEHGSIRGYVRKGNWSMC